MPLQIANGESGASVRTKLNSLLANGVRFMGTIDMSLNLWPATGAGSGTAGAIEKNNEFKNTGGSSTTIFARDGSPIPPGAIMRADIDAPGSTATNWTVYTTLH